jgi:DNA repair protein RadC
MNKIAGAFEKVDYPRERIAKYGVEVLSNAELIAAIIGTGSQQKSVLELSAEIFAHLPEGLKSFDGLTLEELKLVDGVGNGKACQILASVELGKRVYQNSSELLRKISSPSDVSDLLMSELRYKKQEHFKTLILDTKNQIISIETITIGTLNASLVHPREVFNLAIRKSAHGIILVHNHPSGHPEPSKEDLLLTERLVESGKIIGISILDHIIIGDGRFYSFKEQCLL